MVDNLSPILWTGRLRLRKVMQFLCNYIGHERTCAPTLCLWTLSHPLPMPITSLLQMKFMPLCHEDIGSNLSLVTVLTPNFHGKLGSKGFVFHFLGNSSWDHRDGTSKALGSLWVVLLSTFCHQKQGGRLFLYKNPILARSTRTFHTPKISRQLSAMGGCGETEVV
jgi:hypothetical protein